jgi:PII-like signaling protein
MLSPGEAKKVTIHLNEDTSSPRDFLYSEIFRFLYDRGISGATMTRPYSGFGFHHLIHTSGAGSVEGEHLPVRIEFLESADVVDSLLSSLCELVSDGVVEIQATTIVKAASKAQPV